jgi:hypothetical protein
LAVIGLLQQLDLDFCLLEPQQTKHPALLTVLVFFALAFFTAIFPP